MPAGKRCGPFTGAVFKADARQRPERGLAPLAFQPEADIIDHRFPRQQAGILKHHPGIVLDLRQRGRTRQQLSGIGFFQPGQQTQQGAFTAAAAPDHRDELPGGNMKIEFIQNRLAAVTFAYAVKQQRDPRIKTRGGHALAS